MASKWWAARIAAHHLGSVGSSMSSMSFFRKRHASALEGNALFRQLSTKHGLAFSPLNYRTAVRGFASSSALANQSRRYHSVDSSPALRTIIDATSRRRTPFQVRSFHVSGPSRYDRLQNLEETANRNPNNANAQAVFLQVKAGAMWEHANFRPYWKSTQSM